MHAKCISFMPPPRQRTLKDRHLFPVGQAPRSSLPLYLYDISYLAELCHHIPSIFTQYRETISEKYAPRLYIRLQDEIYLMGNTVCENLLHAAVPEKF